MPLLSSSSENQSRSLAVELSALKCIGISQIDMITEYWTLVFNNHTVSLMVKEWKCKYYSIHAYSLKVFCERTYITNVFVIYILEKYFVFILFLSSKSTNLNPTSKNTYYLQRAFVLVYSYKELITVLIMQVL